MKEQFLNMLENAVNWCNEAPGREIFGISYKPSSEFLKPYILISETDIGGGALKLDTFNGIVNLPEIIKAAKLKELQRLQKELNAN